MMIIMIQQQLANRQTELLKELQALSLLCRFCFKSQEELHCEILSDSSKCKNDICLECYKVHKNEACKKCAQKIDSHFPKGKLSIRQLSSDEADKLYKRQFKIRSNQQYKYLDQDFMNLMCYFHSHQHVSTRKKYNEVEIQIKKILQMKGKNQKIVSYTRNHTKQRQLKILQRKIDQTNTGIESCGYNKRYDKGLNLIRMVWGYPTLKSQQFISHSKIIQATSTTNDEQQRMIQEQQLKLKRHNKILQSKKSKDQEINHQFQVKLMNQAKINLY